MPLISLETQNGLCSSGRNEKLDVIYYPKTDTKNDPPWPPLLCVRSGNPLASRLSWHLEPASGRSRSASEGSAPLAAFDHWGRDRSLQESPCLPPQLESPWQDTGKKAKSAVLAWFLSRKCFGWRQRASLRQLTRLQPLITLYLFVILFMISSTTNRRRLSQIVILTSPWLVWLCV